MKKKLAVKKIISLSGHPEFKIEMGSMNKYHPKAVYTIISTWASSDIMITEKMINKLNKEIYNYLYKQSSDLVFSPERNIIICDYSMTDPNTHNGKHFFSIDLTMYQRSLNHPLPWNDTNLQLSMEFYAELVIEYLKKLDFLHFSLNRKENIENTI